MNILILGGTRFIGPHVVRHLLALGHEVTVFNRGNTPNQPLESVRRIIGDRRFLRSFAGQFKAISPSVVIDMCAYNESEAISTMDTFRGIAERVVVVSSMDVYHGWDRFFNRDTSGILQPVPFTETSPLRERLYPKRNQAVDASDWRTKYEKILVERAVLNDRHLPGTVLRLASIYGPGDHQHRLFDMVKRMNDNRSCILIDQAKSKWRWTWGYVENVAWGIILAATDKRAEYQIYNIGEEHTRTQEEWIWSVAKATGWNGKLIQLPETDLPAHLKEPESIDYRQDLVLDSGKIRRELNFTERIPFETSITRTVEWLRKQPPMNVDPREFDYEAEDACLRAHGVL